MARENPPNNALEYIYITTDINGEQERLIYDLPEKIIIDTKYLYQS